MSFGSKVIAITGGAQGIGLATAKLLASRGAKISIADSNPATLAEVERQFTSRNWPIFTAAVDVRKSANVEAWIDETVKKYGQLNGAVNGAATVGKFHGQRPIAELDDDDWALVLAVNVTGVMHCLRAECRHIADGGSIVNISSNLGTKGSPGCAPYATSKHAVVGLTRCAAHDYGSRGIRINAVAPGGTYGPLMHSVVGDDPPPPTAVLGKYAQPEEIAATIAWLLGPDSTHTSGELIRVDGGESV